MNYLFELGNNKALSQAELEAVLGGTFPATMHGNFLIAELTEDIDPSVLMEQLGGIKKIAESF